MPAGMLPAPNPPRQLHCASASVQDCMPRLDALRAAPCHPGFLDAPGRVTGYIRIANLFSSLWDNTNGPQPDRSMHRRPSLLQIFFTSEPLDMKVFNGIFNLAGAR